MVWSRVKDARFIIIALLGALLVLSNVIVGQFSGDMKAVSFILVATIAILFTVYCKRTIGLWTPRRFRVYVDITLFAFVVLSVINAGSTLR
jgi:hypothetical protein